MQSKKPIAALQTTRFSGDGAERAPWAKKTRNGLGFGFKSTPKKEGGGDNCRLLNLYNLLTASN
jgi:hypothetical protein